MPSFSPGWEAPTSSLKPTEVGREQEHEGQLWTQWNQKAGKLELMELENIVANTVYLKAREGELSKQSLQMFLPHLFNYASIPRWWWQQQRQE